MKTIAITNQKGGVGKTTISFNLSRILADKFKKKVLVIDNDPQGNLSSSFVDENRPFSSGEAILDAYDENKLKPIEISKNLHLLGANINLAPVAERAFPVIFNLKGEILKLDKSMGKQSYDFCIIDCLPSFGHLNLAALFAADYVLIPVKPSPYALAGMQDLFKTISKVRKNLNKSLKILGIVINQVEGRKTLLQNDMQEALRENYQDLVFKTMIKKRIRLEESPIFQKDIASYNPRSQSAEEFLSLAKELLKRLKSFEKKGEDQ